MLLHIRLLRLQAPLRPGLTPVHLTLNWPHNKEEKNDVNEVDIRREEGVQNYVAPHLQRSSI